jgi:hypothetical protein
MGDAPRDKKSTLIDELDLLRFTLNSGPEFQHDIPTLNEPYSEDGAIMHDPALDIPILTDVLEEKPAFTEETTPVIEEQLDNIPNNNTSNHLPPPEAPTPQPDEQHTHNVNKLQEETDSSVTELEQVLDELVAEQLPKLEQQLRDKLRHDLEDGVDTNLESNPEPSLKSTIHT